MLTLSLALLSATMSAPSAAERSQARKLKNQAFELISEGRYAEGIERLEAAYEAVPHPTFLFNVAVVYDQWSGHCAESLDAFDRFFAVCKRCKVKPTATARFARVQERCQVRLSIETTPPGALVRVDDADRGATPLNVVLTPGRHQVELRRDGYQPSREEVLLEPGRDQALSLTLSPTPKPEPPAIVVATSPPARAPDRTWAWVSFGVGAAGVAMGAVFTGLALDTENQANDLQASNAAISDIAGARDDARSRGALALVGYGVGLAGVATGIALWLVEPSPAASGDVQLGTDGRQLFVSGRF